MYSSYVFGKAEAKKRVSPPLITYLQIQFNTFIRKLELPYIDLYMIYKTSMLGGQNYF